MSKQCPVCGNIVSDKKYNRHRRVRCGKPGVKKFIRILSKHLAGYRLPMREQRYLHNFLNTTPVKEMERILRRHVHKIDTPLSDIERKMRISSE